MLRLLLVCTIFGFWSTVFYAQETEPNPFTIKWDNGFKIDSKDKKFKLKFGGRIMLDHAYFSQDDDLDAAFGPLESKDGTEFRRARFFISGLIYKNVEFKLNVDFAGGEARMKDAFIGVKNIPVIGRIRVGHVKEPIRFDALSSSKYFTFMERAIPADFANERNNGILLMNDFLDDKLSIQAGFFRNSDAFGNDKAADDGMVFTGRTTTLAIDNKEKEQLLHLGVGYSHRKPDEEVYNISVRPKSHLGQKYISTGNIENVETVNIVNFETVYSAGAFSFQAEYLNSNLKQKLPDFSETYSFNNYYGQVSYFITGEHRPYKSSYDTFGRLKPKNNFMDGGSGAWEVALRYTHTDLNSKTIKGGEQGDITFGTNWYLNSATRVMFNYVWADIKKEDVGSGNINIFEFRFQIDF